MISTSDLKSGSTHLWLFLCLALQITGRSPKVFRRSQHKHWQGMMQVGSCLRTGGQVNLCVPCELCLWAVPCLARHQQCWQGGCQWTQTHCQGKQFNMANIGTLLSTQLHHTASPKPFTPSVSHLAVRRTGKSLCFPLCFRFVTGSAGCSVLQHKTLSNSIPSKKPFTCLCSECCSKILENKEPQGPKNTQPRGGQEMYTAMAVKVSSREFSPASGQRTCSPGRAHHTGCCWIPRAVPACGLHQPAKAHSRASSCWVIKDQVCALKCIWGEWKGLHGRKRQIFLLCLRSPASSVKRIPFICTDIYLWLSKANETFSHVPYSLSIVNFVFSWILAQNFDVFLLLHSHDPHPEPILCLLQRSCGTCSKLSSSTLQEGFLTSHLGFFPWHKCMLEWALKNKVGIREVSHAPKHVYFWTCLL